MSKRKYIYYSGNISNISKLDEVIKNRRQSAAFDQIIFLSTNSNYQMPKEEHGAGWFRVGYKKLGELVGYQQRQLITIIQKFESLGLIEKIRPIIGSKNVACLRISKKAKCLVGLLSDNIYQHEQHVDKRMKRTDDCVHLTQDCTSENADNALAYKEEREKKENCNISNITFTVEKENGDNSFQSYKRIFNEVGERLSTRQKKYIAGCINKIYNNREINISKPRVELFSEFVYEILNSSFMPTAKTLQHRLNICVSLIKNNRWTTPRGFYKYSNLGEGIKASKEAKEAEYHVHKLKETKGRYAPNRALVTKKTRESIQLHDSSHPTFKLKELLLERADLRMKYQLVMSDANSFEFALKNTNLKGASINISNGLKNKRIEANKLLQSIQKINCKINKLRQCSHSIEGDNSNNNVMYSDQDVA